MSDTTTPPDMQAEVAAIYIDRRTIVTSVAATIALIATGCGRGEPAPAKTGSEAAASPSSDPSATAGNTQKPELSKSTDQQLRKLAKYESIFGPDVADKLMLFCETPTTSEDAKTQASKMAVTMAEFKKFGKEPLIVFEPQANGKAVSFSGYEAGDYDKALDDYFATLKIECARLGLSDEDIAKSTWVFGPEINMPVWSEMGKDTAVTPAAFTAIVTKTAQALKNNMPTAKATVLLDSATYKTNDWDSEYGYYSLVPYTRNIPQGLIDSLGIQGFPWLPAPGKTGTEKINPEDYFNAKQATDAANALGVTEVWLNTGTFGSKYTDGQQPLVAPNTLRAKILDDVVAQAGKIQAEGFKVSVNLFAQDKSRTPEATDWSYLADPDKQRVFKDLREKCRTSGIGFSLFDA
jgi:hypothetical protein